MASSPQGTIGPWATVRHFFGRHYVVNRTLGTVQVIDPETFRTLLTFSVGALKSTIDLSRFADKDGFVNDFVQFIEQREVEKSGLAI